MYGLVNQGIKDLVVSKFGEAAWSNICNQAESPTDFVSMQYYEDAITYKLVGAASKLLSIPADKVLSEFGKHWILYTAKEGYGPIMELFGANFKACLINLNHLHTRMGMTLPKLKPPSFKFKEVDPKNYIVEYHSSRKGLEPMVQGLLEGLAIKYDLKATISLLENSESDSFRSFKISILG